VNASLSYTLIDGLENLVLTGTSGLSGTGNAAANQITGNSGANALQGLAGNDSLDGGNGNDTLDGGQGADTMSGGTGNDTFLVDDVLDVLIEASVGGTDTVVTSMAYVLLSEFENLTLTGSGDVAGTGNELSNVITGTTGANLLSGLAGNDTIAGGSGNDTLDGGAGHDSLVGGDGNDTFILDSANDRISETSTGGYDVVQANFSFSLTSYFEELVLTGTDAINGTGNSASNTITGNGAANLLDGGSSGNDTLIGNGGDDTLIGDSGADSLVGGEGNDLYVVDSGSDVVVELADQGIDTVQSSVSIVLGDNLENLIFTGSLAASGTGNTADNRLTGNTSGNTLNGLGGNDSLTGAAGNDNLTGGAGADQFIYTTGSQGVDTITDFNALDGGLAEGDLLVFSGLLTGTFGYRGAAAFTGGGNTEARIQGNQVQMDFNGDAISDLSITLTGLTNAAQLAASDFLFV